MAADAGPSARRDSAAGDSGRVAVRFRGVSRHFDKVRAVDDLNLDIAEGEFFALLGPSGSGKTTSLRLIAGFERPTAGEVEIFGAPSAALPPYRRPVNTVFQDYALFPHLNVRDNVAFGLRVAGQGKADRHRAADAALALVALPGFGDRMPAQLSGGQRQRVALARALVNRPRVLLLDEPLGALDLKLREQMQIELKGLQRQLGITFVFVTHDQGEALSMADRIAVFNDGRIQQVGTPRAVYDRPETPFVADFVGSSNVLPPALVQRLAGQAVPASLRPEAIRLAPEGHAAQVTGTTFLGPVQRIGLSLDGVGLTALLPAGIDAPAPGATVRLAWDPAALHLMPEPARG